MFMLIPNISEELRMHMRRSIVLLLIFSMSRDDQGLVHVACPIHGNAE